jgi:LmbE family N-acetylglucosaminyl deacetylase
MRSLFISKKPDEPLNVLCLGAHCDDIEIGCGGSLLELLSERSSVNVYWQVYASTPSRKKEAVAGAQKFCAGAESLEVDILEFRDGYFPYDGAAIKDAFEQTKSVFAPDLIFTHYKGDLHQDHRIVSELTWNTYRNHVILEYEVPKFDGGLGSPNVFMPISADHMEQKTETLLSCYESQAERSWFSKSTFEALMRLRGIECNSESGYAEAFYSRKIVLG